MSDPNEHTQNGSSESKHSERFEIKKTLLKYSKINYEKKIKTFQIISEFHKKDGIEPIEMSLATKSGENNVFSAFDELQKKECKHTVIVGNSGIGKTTLIMKLWHKFLNGKSAQCKIPILVELSKYDEGNDWFILKTVLKEYLGVSDASVMDVNTIIELLKSPFLDENNERFPVVVLFLDGFDKTEKDNKNLMIEIGEINDNLKGVQLAFTSKYDLRGIFRWDDFNKLEVLELKNAKIKKYLDKFVTNPQYSRFGLLSEQLKDILKIPMMLALYVVWCRAVDSYKYDKYFDWKFKVKTCSGIIGNYVELKLAKKILRDSNEIYRFALKHVLSYIGYRMDKKGCYTLNVEEFEGFIQNALKFLEDDNFFEVFKKYLYCKNELKSYCAKENSIKTIGKILIEIGFIKYEHNRGYFFAHVIFRGYFAAQHVINEIEKGIYTKIIPKALKELPLNHSIIKFVAEIEKENLDKSSNTEVKTISTNIGVTRSEKILAILKEKFDKEAGYTIWNIVEILKETRGELSGCDFSQLNLSNLILNETSFGKLSNNSPAADFSGALINLNNVFDYGHSDQIMQVAISDGKIVSGSLDKTVKIWDINTGELLNTLTGHTNYVYSVAINEGRVVSGSWDKTIKVWDVITGNLLNTLQGHGDFVRCVAIREEKIVSGSLDKTIKIWDSNTGKLLNTLIGHTNYVYSVAISEGKVVSGSRDKTVKIWDVNTGELLNTLEGHIDSIASVAVRDGKVVSGSWDKTIKIWDVNTGELLKTLEGHDEYITGVAIRRGRIISSSVDKSIKVWDITTGRLLCRLEGHFSRVNGVTIREGKIISCSSDKELKIWSLHTGELLKTLGTNRCKIACIAINGDKVAIALDDNKIRVWNITKTELLNTLEAHTDRILSLAMDERLIVSGSWDETVRVWEASTGTLISTLKGHKSYVKSVALGEDRIISGSGDKTIKVWDASTGELLNTLKGHKSYIESVLIYEGKIISSSLDKCINIWDVNTGQLLKTLTGHLAHVGNIAINDGKLVSGSSDRTIKIWDVNTGELLKTLVSHTDHTVCITLYERYIFSISRSGKTIKVWDMNTGELIKVLKGHTDDVKGLAVSCGKLVSGAEDGVVKIWNIDTLELANEFENLSGLFIKGCDFSKLHIKSKVLQKDMDILRMYGARGIENVVCQVDQDVPGVETGKNRTINIKQRNSNGITIEILEDILIEQSRIKCQIKMKDIKDANSKLKNLDDIGELDEVIKIDINVNNKKFGSDKFGANTKFPAVYAIENLQSKMNWHCVIVGESGIGKTTTLLKFWQGFGHVSGKKPISIFVDISRYNVSKYEDDFIIRSILKEYVTVSKSYRYEDVLWEFMKYPYEKDKSKYPAMVLLLDGFNEVTKDNQKLVAELDYIKKNMNGVQIIMTVRTDMREMFEWEDFNKIEIMNLEDEYIKKFFKDKNENFIELDRELVKILRKPMMLTLYNSTLSVMENYRQNTYFEWKQNAETQGEIIWNHIESQLSKKVDEDKSEIYYFECIIKHIMPYLAFVMEKSGVYCLDEVQFKAALNDILKVMENNCFYEVFEKYVYCEQKFKLKTGSYKEKTGRFDSIKNIMLNEIGILRIENGEYKFIHGLFRDYFTALHILNEISLGVYLCNVPKVLRERPLNHYIMKFIGEIDGEHHNKPYRTGDSWKISYDGGDRLENMLDILREKFDGGVGYSVWNIVEVWKISRGELSGCNLSKLDLSSLMINGTRCSRVCRNKLVANFNKSIINEKSILNYSHLSSVSSVAIREGKLVSGSWDATVKVWDIKTGELLNILEGHTDAVYCVAIRDGKVISGSWDKTIKIWDIGTGELINMLDGQSGSVYGIAVAEGKIVSCYNDKIVKVWDLNTGELLNMLEGHNDAVYSIAIKDGKIVSGSRDRTIKIWDSKTGELLRTLVCNTASVSSIAVMEGKIALGLGDKTVRIWDINTGIELNVLEGHLEYVSSVAIREGKIVSGSGDKTVKVWNVNTGELLNTLEGHTSYVYSVAMREGKIVSGSLDNTIRIWDLNTGKLINMFENIAGLFVKGCDFTELHPKSELSVKNLKILKMYGAKV